MTTDTSIFPLIKRFKDVKSLNTTVMLTDDIVIYDKAFRKGTIFSILGFKEINMKTFLIITKGSWESLVDYSFFFSKTVKL